MQNSDWSRGFWILTQEPDFTQTSGLCIKLEEHQYFHIQVKKVHLNGLDFCQNPENLDFGSFWGLFGSSGPAEISDIEFRHFSYFMTNVIQKIRNW